MTLEEISNSSIEKVAKWLISANACPLESGEEKGCIYNQKDDRDCQACWEMHLNGESREEGEYIDPKETGRGYYA